MSPGIEGQSYNCTFLSRETWGKATAAKATAKATAKETADPSSAKKRPLSG